ncbi:hypothetical protein TTHERM_000763080 (macronuclear) [Tetrahymena thermophila SB210]|uniref:Uncharacterized protein n=1 Tax=Tetrahymena thermophila (strain SB210) TaxID=312017 RepID=W7XCT6_TETTS|nr:hypothetical protein TTHERM_000763080 [Tetrahymena thermophila SB210]EWS71611.1 hypothetical protein TTHERM_000763080 [Tetrahymena thermophila SB210]|eukprot:XP_012655856.1 hypothetical protein TTHERM_000763080 [Tetrahymena thermophila SB210]
MKSDIKLKPDNKQLLASLFTQFFRDHLLTQTEHQRDKDAYEKNFDLWQKFVKVINQDLKLEENDNFQNNQDLVQQLVIAIDNYKQSHDINANYIEEISQLLSSSLNKSNDVQEQGNSSKKFEKASIHSQRRQLSIPPKPSLILGDSLVEEEKLTQEYNYKQGYPIRTHKKNNTAILSQSKSKQIKEGYQLQGQKSPFNQALEVQNLNKNSNIQSCQNIFNGIQNIQQKSTQRADEEIQNNFLELQQFLKQKNTKNIQEITQNLMQEQAFKQSKNIYILKSNNSCNQKMNIMNQFLYAVSIQHYQDLIQNSSQEQWQQIIQFFKDEKKTCQYNLAQDINKSNKMSQYQKSIMKALFTEMSENIQRQDKTQQTAFYDFLQRAQSDEILAQSLLVSLKEKIVNTCKLEECDSFRNEVFNNWFVKNPNTNLVGIDSQKLKLLSFSLQKRISILKVTQTINCQSQIQSSSSLEVVQSFEHSSDNGICIPSINILWHNTHQYDHFYLILNDQQQAFYQNKSKQKIQSMQQPFIQTKEISLQKCISEMQSSSTQPQNFSLLQISKQQSDQPSQLLKNNSNSYMSQNNLNGSQKKQREEALIEKYSSSTSNFSRSSIEPKFSKEGLQNLKQKTQKLKLMMIDNSFTINSIQMQIENNWKPSNQYNQQNVINIPSIPSNQLEQQFKKIDQFQLKINSQLSPFIKPLNDINNQNTNLRYQSNIQIQLLKNQDQDILRGRENCQNQIKLLNQCSFRSASQNNFFKQKEEQSQHISLIPNLQSNQSQITSNISPTKKNQASNQARLRIQSGHVVSAHKISEDNQDRSGITLLGQSSQKSNISPFINLYNEENSIKCTKMEENKKEDSSDKYQSNYDSNTSQIQIQLLNKQQKNILNSNQVDESDKNILKALGLTSSTSTNSTIASNTASNINTPNNFIQNNSCSRQASFFMRNSPNYMNNNNSPQTDSGVKLIKSLSTNQHNIQFTNPKQIPSINDFRFYQEFLLQNKQNTPQQNCIKNQQINHKYISLQQNIAKS